MVQDVRDLLTPTVSEAEENRILKEVIEEEAEGLEPELRDAFPDLTISPGVRLPPRERFWRFMGEPNSGQRMMLWRDLPFLLRPDYIDLFRQGLMPPLESWPWADLLELPAWIFREVQSDFRQLYRVHSEEIGGA